MGKEGVFEISPSLLTSSPPLPHKLTGSAVSAVAACVVPPCLAVPTLPSGSLGGSSKTGALPATRHRAHSQQTPANPHTAAIQIPRIPSGPSQPGEERVVVGDPERERPPPSTDRGHGVYSADAAVIAIVSFWCVLRGSAQFDKRFEGEDPVQVTESEVKTNRAGLIPPGSTERRLDLP